MINPNDYMERKFNWENYTCFHFVRDVWKDHTGTDLGTYFPEDNTVRAWARAFQRHSGNVIASVLTEIKEPVNPCLVLFTNRTPVPHCGVMVDGRILHLPKEGNAKLDPIEEVVHDYGATSLRYFR